MKFKVGSIVLLHNGKTVYIYQVDKESKTYYVNDCENSKDCFTVKEHDIFYLLTST